MTPTETINENNHPFRHDIIGADEYQLMNRRPYASGAVEAWKENVYNATPERQAYNIAYFQAELNLINKELKRFQ